MRSFTAPPANAARRQFSTSGPLSSLRPHWPPDGAAHANPDLWWKVTWFVALPAVAVVSVWTWYKEYQHAKHYVRPPFVPMEYLRIRTKPFPWGDGNHTLFHNPIKNPLPTGYENLDEIKLPWYLKIWPHPTEEEANGGGSHAGGHH